MATRKSHTVGVRNHNPNMANSPAGSEGTVNPSAVVPPVQTAPTVETSTALSAKQLYLVEAGAKTFREDFARIVTVFVGTLGAFPTPDKARAVSVSVQHKDAAAQYAGLLRQYPGLTTGVSADTIEAALAASAALAMVKTDLQGVLPTVEFCGRQSGHIAWSDSRVVRHAAEGQALQDTTLAAQVATIEGTLQRGRKVAASANRALKAQTAASKAQEKAARAAAKATKAAETATRAAQAHANNHPLTADVVIVPAGSTTPVNPAPGTPTGTTPRG